MPIGRVGSDFVVTSNSSSNGDQTLSSISALSDGRFVVTWQSDDTSDDNSGTCIRGQVFTPSGDPLTSSTFRLATTFTGDQTATSVVGLPDGRFVVAWQSADAGDGSSGCIRARVFNADGEFDDSLDVNDFIVNTTLTGDQTVPSVTVLTDGRFIVTWQSTDTGDGDGGCVRGRIYNAEGLPDTSVNGGNDFIVNTTAGNNQVVPSVAALANGRFLVTWQSADTGDGSLDCIRGRVYGANGLPDATVNGGNDFIVNSTATGVQAVPATAELTDGRFIVTWQSTDTGDGANGCIRARIYNADGTPDSAINAGNDFIVNTTSPGAQLFPAVTALADGRFVITWQSNENSDGSGFCVRARLYNIDGSAAGDDFIANSTTDNNQFAPAVTALADGRFVVTFQSVDFPGDGDGFGIRAQIFDPTVFNGTSVVDTWKGGNLADHIYGANNDDILSGLDGNDVINGDNGNDTLAGNNGNDTLFGGKDDDTLDGGSGADTMLGGADNDTYKIDSAADRVTETAGGGNDTAIASATYVLQAGSSVELLRTTGSSGTTAINLTGNELVQTLQGNAAANTLDGRGGADTMQGFAGDDTYLVDNSGDAISDTSGNDRVIVTAAINYTLAANLSIETLRTTGSSGTTAINLTGNELVQTLQGNAAANTLDGRGGADTMQGFAGDDTYLVDNSGDAISDTSGNDRVIVTAAINYTLAANLSIETLRTTGSSSTYVANLNGNNLANAIQGNAAAGVLNGGLDTDTLTGFGGKDTFRFNTALGPSNIDTITDFVVVDDTIQIDNAVFAGLSTGTLAAIAFRIGSAAADADDRIIYNSATGALLFDDDGTGVHAAIQFAKATTGLAMTNADIIVI